MKIILTIELEQPTQERIEKVMSNLAAECQRTLRRTDHPLWTLETEPMKVGEEQS